MKDAVTGAGAGRGWRNTRMPVSPSGAPTSTPRASSSQTRSVGTPRTDAASVIEYPSIIGR